MNRRTKSLATLWLAAVLGVATAASAQPRKEIREDRKEKREDRKEIREDKNELREDKKNGADPKEIAEDKKELREDKKELREDKKELREDRRDRRQARRKEVRAKWGELTKHPAAQAELKIHARRIARLERARKVADEAGKKEVVARIDKLLEKERARHQKTMEKLKDKAPGTTPSGAATPGAVPPGGKP